MVKTLFIYFVTAVKTQKKKIKCVVNNKDGNFFLNFVIVEKDHLHYLLPSLKLFITLLMISTLLIIASYMQDACYIST